ncbi:MAG: potassium transporter TrkH [Hyphomicrobiales bacterium]|nr:TrkH family potassium uptake protein [Rickettsiales bacterium]MCP5361236.1 potassium transporter TrkH [Hyphomicrobiales bacterium]
MAHLGPIFLIIGILLTILASAMLIPAAVDYYVMNPDWKNFAASAFFTAFVGIALIFTNQNRTSRITLKQTFVLTTLSWLVLGIFAAIPLRFARLGLSYTDAFFEAMSGLTTTGSTVIVGLDMAPPGLLLWRAILQWLGGIGIIVLAMAVLPILKIGGMQLFRTESSDRSEKVLPRAKQFAAAIGGFYIFLTLFCATCLWLAGMSGFDAICHAMTTVATGGFSTHDASILYYDSIKIETVLFFFMLFSGVPFVLYIQFFRGRPMVLWRDMQVRWYLFITFGCIIAITCWLYFFRGYYLLEAIRLSSFNVVSVITTTGYASDDYGQWGSFAILFFFLFSVTGGCTGSTAGGIKIFRYQVLFETAKVQLNRLVQPHGIFRPLYNNKPLEETIISSVLSFFILFAFFFTSLAILLSLTGLDYITSMSAAASALANLGPGLGEIVGPAGNFSDLTDIAKWMLAFGMLIGRLEIFTVLILFSPYFWRN